MRLKEGETLLWSFLSLHLDCSIEGGLLLIDDNDSSVSPSAQAAVVFRQIL